MRTGLAITAALLAGVASGCGARPASQEPADIVYAVGPESGWKVSGLYLADADGNRHARLTSDSLPRATYARWSPVGDSILVESWLGLPPNGDVWTINADGTGVRRIAGGVGATWSPDGREIAVVKDGGEIEILSSEGVHLRTIDLGIPRDNAVDQAPAWSPDGRMLALQDRGEGVLYVVRADGKGGARPVVTGLADLVSEVNPAWSPDGKRLGFTRESDTDEAWTSRPDGSDLRLVARDVDVLTWSVDGEALIGESTDDFRTYRYPLDGGEPRLLSGAEERRAVAQGRISPDGKRMVAVLDSGRLVVSRLDGSDPKELTRPVTDSSPVWSPDGAEIAFLRASGSSEGESDVYLIRANGKGERQIGSPSAVRSLSWWGPIDWSPDGTALLGQTGPEGSIETTVMRVDTGQVWRMPGAAWNAAWSPDGSRIALVVDRFPGRPGAAEGRSTLYSVRRDGTDWRRLAEVRSDGVEHAVVFSLPVWMPDQETILVGEYDRAEESPARIRQIPVSGGRDRAIVQDASGKFPGWAVSPDGKQLAFLSYEGIETVSFASGERALVVRLRADRVSGLAWSPDGQELGYLVLDAAGERSSLYVVKRDGSRRRMVSKPGESVTSFDWRPEATTE
jgi:Tol biopolymer transport system component